MNDWLKFFLVRLPLALLGVAVVVEILAYGLGGVALHRHNVDDLALAVQKDSKPYPVVLLGDSVTHTVTHKFRVGAPGEVADLTTHAAAGLPSSMFLLKRYLESGHRPKVVVLTPSIHVLTEPMAKGQFDYYLTSVFTRPWEKAFLSRNYPDYVDYRWKPAAFNMTTRLGEPLFSLIRHPGTDIWISPEVAAEHPALEHFADPENDAAKVSKRIEESSQILPENVAILTEFARLAHQYQFEFKIMWPPMYPPIHDGVVSTGRMKGLEQRITGITQGEGASVSFYDANSLHVYPYFDHDLIHIKGVGWEQVYANDLSSFLDGQVHS